MIRFVLVCLGTVGVGCLFSAAVAALERRERPSPLDVPSWVNDANERVAVWLAPPS